MTDILGDYLALMMRADNDELKSRVGTARKQRREVGDGTSGQSVEIPVRRWRNSGGWWRASKR